MNDSEPHLVFTRTPGCGGGFRLPNISINTIVKKNNTKMVMTPHQGICEGGGDEPAGGLVPVSSNDSFLAVTIVHNKAVDSKSRPIRIVFISKRWFDFLQKIKPSSK